MQSIHSLNFNVYARDPLSVKSNNNSDLNIIFAYLRSDACLILEAAPMNKQNVPLFPLDHTLYSPNSASNA